MSTVLWVSRHPLMDEQISGLHRTLGDDVEIIQRDAYVSSGDDVVALADEVGADVIAAVLPRAFVRNTESGPVLVDVLQETLERTDRPVIQAVTNHRNVNGVHQMEFVGWNRTEIDPHGGFKQSWF